MVHPTDWGEFIAPKTSFGKKWQEAIPWAMPFADPCHFCPSPLRKGYDLVFFHQILDVPQRNVFQTLFLQVKDPGWTWQCGYGSKSWYPRNGFANTSDDQFCNRQYLLISSASTRNVVVLQCPYRMIPSYCISQKEPQCVAFTVTRVGPSHQDFLSNWSSN